VSLNAGERLRFARQVLLGLGLICFRVFVAHAKGMTELAREPGLAREQFYRSFSMNGNPTLKTLLAVMRAVGIDMTVRLHV
jgi:probable addiction module antidote protein